MNNDTISLAIECFDAIHCKLLWINITHINQLMTEIHGNQINLSLRNVLEFAFNRQSILRITIFSGEAKRIPAVSFTTSLQEVFYLNETDSNNKLNYSNITTDILQEILVNASLDMKELFPIRWTNRVFCKFWLISVKSPDILLPHTMDKTLNPKLNTKQYLSMDNTTIQVLAQALPCFCMDRKYNVDVVANEAEWTI